MGRPHRNAMRSAIKPGRLCVDSKDKPSGIRNGTEKQYNFPKVKNTAPNYPQKDPNIVVSDDIKGL